MCASPPPNLRFRSSARAKARALARRNWRACLGREAGETGFYESVPGLPAHPVPPSACCERKHCAARSPQAGGRQKRACLRPMLARASVRRRMRSVARDLTSGRPRPRRCIRRWQMLLLRPPLRCLPQWIGLRYNRASDGRHQTAAAAASFVGMPAVGSPHTRVNSRYCTW